MSVAFFSFSPKEKVDTTIFKETVELKLPPLAMPALKAFPTAEGFGRNTTGGRGGTLYQVTNLNDSGSGSLRAALEASGARIVVFRVSGTINLSNTIYINDDNLTIAGQTSPNGIIINGGEINITASNIIIRNIRVSNSDVDGISIRNFSNSTIVQNIIIDHCSITDSDDENIGITQGPNAEVIRNITVQHSVLSNATYGLLVGAGTENISIIKNYFPFNGDRNPKFGSAFGLDEIDKPFRAEQINNIAYGMGNLGEITYGLKTDHIGNVFKDYNSQTFADFEAQIYQFSDDGDENDNQRPFTEIFLNDNVVINSGSSTNNPSRVLEFSNISEFKESNRIGGGTYNPVTAASLPTLLLSDVGAKPTDSYDEAYINAYGTGANNPNPALPTFANGTPYTDADGDGIDDTWETLHGITDPDAINPSWTNLGGADWTNAVWTNQEVFFADLMGDWAALAGTSTPATPTCSDGIQNGTETGVDCGGSCTACPSSSNAIVDFQATYEELVQAPEVATRHKNGYTNTHYPSDLIQDRKTLLDNYMAEANHLLWGTSYVYAGATLPENPLATQTETEARRDEPYFSGAHPEYDDYNNYTNALHVAAQYAYLFTQETYSGVDVTINGVTKAANLWAVDIAQKVLLDLHETVTDDDLDIWNGTYRTNATWGTATRYVKGTHFKPINPYFVSISKASAMWDSFALISQVIDTDATFLSQQQIIYDWLDEFAEFVDAALATQFDYYVPGWEAMGNYELIHQNSAITATTSYNQTHYYSDSNGNGLSSKIHVSADAANNRNMGHLEYLFKNATYTKDATLKTRCEAYFRRVMEIISKEGLTADQQRIVAAQTNPLNYPHIIVGEIAMIAVHDAIANLNQGNTTTYAALYNRLYTEGIEDRYPSLDSTFETANPNKNIKFVLDAHSDWINNTNKYDYGGNLITTGNGTMTLHAQLGQLFGADASYTSYLDSFGNGNTYNSALWGGENRAVWYKGETILGGIYSIADMPNLFPQAAIARNNLGTETPEPSSKKMYVGGRQVQAVYRGSQRIDN